MEQLTNCPWSGYEPATAKFCEERLCAWVVEPANTWSNIAYFIVGVLILYLSRKEQTKGLGIIGAIAVAVSIGSTFFHASATFMGEVVDIFAMFLFANYMICFNWWRLRTTSLPKLVAAFSLLSLAALLLLILIKPIGIFLFGFLVACAFVIEIILFRRHWYSKEDYRPLIKLIGFFSVSFVIWRLDFKGRLCDPYNHFIQGHAVWHLLNSFCFYYLYRFHQRILSVHRTWLRT